MCEFACLHEHHMYQVTYLVFVRLVAIIIHWVGEGAFFLRTIYRLKSFCIATRDALVCLSMVHQVGAQVCMSRPRFG